LASPYNGAIVHLMADTSRQSGDREVAERLNRACFCVTLDRPSLETSLRGELGEEAFTALVGERRHLFAEAPVFLPRRDVNSMLNAVGAIEAAAHLSDYQAAVLDWAPPLAAIDFGPRGAFMGYDFHAGDEGARLIEVNTNAGGAFFNALLARAQVACCAPVERALDLKTLDAFQPSVVAMFESEWRAQGGVEPLRRIAVIDDAPNDQYLYPEFLIAKSSWSVRASRRSLQTPAIVVVEIRRPAPLLAASDAADGDTKDYRREGDQRAEPEYGRKIWLVLEHIEAPSIIREPEYCQRKKTDQSGNYMPGDLVQHGPGRGERRSRTHVCRNVASS
jgi:hypothetical protein